MEDTIQFIAKHGDWVVVKKTKPNEHPPLDNALFLASILASITERLEKYLEDALDLGPLEQVVDEILKEKKGVCEVLSAVNGPKVGKVINSMVDGLELQKKEKEAIKALLKAYALRRAMKALKLKADYSVAAEELRKGLGKFKKGRNS